MLAEEIRGIVECSRLRPEMRRQNGIGNVVGFAARAGAQDTDRAELRAINNVASRLTEACCMQSPRDLISPRRFPLCQIRPNNNGIDRAIALLSIVGKNRVIFGLVAPPLRPDPPPIDQRISNNNGCRVFQVRPIRTTMPHLGVSFPESLDMALDEQQKLLNTGGRSQLSVTIVEVGGTPQPSPLSDRSSQQLLETPLDSGFEGSPVDSFVTFAAPSTTCCQGLNAASLLIESPPKWGDAARYASRQHRKIAGRATFQGQVYNFLERPDNWKCFVYHIVVDSRPPGARSQMLSLVMFRDMNRSEQESLYRTSRKLSLVPIGGHFDGRREEPADDLVLSVLKSPVNHVSRDDDAAEKQHSEEEECSERLPFLQRLRGHRVPRFGEAHHKRVPTPLKRKQRFGRNHKAKDVVQQEDVVDEEDDDVEAPSDAPRGVPDPYYPIYLPIDQAFKAKYVFHHKKGKTCQERTYVFLEHPGGWLCFIYHFTVCCYISVLTTPTDQKELLTPGTVAAPPPSPNGSCITYFVNRRPISRPVSLPPPRLDTPTTWSSRIRREISGRDLLVRHPPRSAINHRSHATSRVSGTVPLRSNEKMA
ncbi:hypothetical protein GEV33_010115 [Tenebrio molitor]|uniref:Uncharacterized protein n=1 Tax=Tenebrio molitor TaxID=7067 RepID=A0A8J6LGU3_TENMO|nr:hypothetical protein GEV33_010115 [Tenebrio molitor]